MNKFAVIRSRLVSRKELGLAFAAIAFPIHVWTIIQVLEEIPAWILRFSTWELIGAIAYTQAFALLESLVILSILTAVGFALPKRMYREKFIAISGMLVFLSAAWAIIAHHNDEIIRLWGLRQFASWTGLYTLSVILSGFMVLRFERLAKSLRFFSERLTVLISVYLFVDLASVLVIILRNL